MSYGAASKRAPADPWLQCVRGVARVEVPAACLNGALPETGLDRGASAGDQLEYQRDHSQHQKYVDKSTHGVATDHSQQPENKQNYK